MATEHEYVVLPVSALKAEASRVFEALSAGRTVYVSKRGEIQAAFRPFEVVPEGIAAAYASPGGFVAPEITARQLGRSVPSAAITEAVEGLPSLVTKNGHIYGVLTAARAPSLAATPDLNIAGARAEAVRRYQEEHPDASLDDVVELTESWSSMDDTADPTTAFRPKEQDDPSRDPALVEIDERVLGDLRSWRARGSPVEAVVETVLKTVARVIVGASLAPTITVAVPDVLKSIYRTTGSGELAVLRAGERLEAKSDVVSARTSYVAALLDDAVPASAMWRLGDLSRREGYLAEATAWYQLALRWHHVYERGPVVRINARPAAAVARVRARGDVEVW